MTTTKPLVCDCCGDKDTGYCQYFNINAPDYEKDPSFILERGTHEKYDVLCEFCHLGFRDNPLEHDEDMEEITIEVVDEHGNSSTVDIPVTPELKEAIEESANIVWCQCEDKTRVKLFCDGECKCPIHKHHYHCTTCGNVVQIG